MLYRRYIGQWRSGPAGPYALDMSIFHLELTRKGYKGEEFDSFINKLMVIEDAALRHIHKK